MARVQLIHWKESEGRGRADELRALGHSVQYEADGSAALALLRAEPVDVIAIARACRRTGVPRRMRCGSGRARASCRSCSSGARRRSSRS